MKITLTMGKMMALPVKLRDVVDQMDVAGDEITAYINRRDGELVILVEGEFSLDDDESGAEWQQEAKKLDERVSTDDDFIGLPDQYEINEYAIMEQFCESLEDQRKQESLLAAIQGRGAFRRFKDMVYAQAIEEDWFAFKNVAIKRIAAEFLDHENIPYTDD
jgi:hypothetical protein